MGNVFAGLEVVNWVIDFLSIFPVRCACVVCRVGACERTGVLVTA